MLIKRYQCLLLELFFRASEFFRINDVSDESTCFSSVLASRFRVECTTVNANGSVEGNLSFSWVESAQLDPNKPAYILSNRGEVLESVLRNVFVEEDNVNLQNVKMAAFVKPG